MTIITIKGVSIIAEMRKVSKNRRVKDRQTKEIKEFLDRYNDNKD